MQMPIRGTIDGGGRSGPRWCAVALTAVALAVVGAGCDRAPTSPATTAVSVVGRSACIACHEEAHEAWEGSHHDLAMQEPTDATVLGDFNDASFTYHGVTTTFFRRGGEFWVRTDGPDGNQTEYPVAYTFGVHPLQQYLIRFPGGRMQALNVCWDTRPKEGGGQRWFHLYPGENITHEDILHWTGPYQNWNHMCAECHSTDVRKGYDAAAGSFKTTWAEIDVSCEACHGPGSRHVAWARANQGRVNPPGPPGLGLLSTLREAERAAWVMEPATGIARRSKPRQNHDEIEACARCHSRRGTFDEGYTPGRPILDTHRVVTLEEELYEADGQIRDEVYEYGSFLQSKMYAAGVTCTDCHDPHTLKTAGGNRTCAKCHDPVRFDVPAHHKHKADGLGAACVACHAPTKNYMVVHARHDHSFRVPRPDLTVKLGTPNACNQCHADQSAQWAAEAAAGWWGPARAAQPHVGELIHAGRRGAPGSAAALAELLKDANAPGIMRATAADMLAGGGESPGVAEALRAGLSSADPLVRMASVRAVAARAGSAEALVRDLGPLLNDPVRAVRMEAARALARVPGSALTPDLSAARAKGLEEYRAGESLNADRAESRLNLGTLAIDLGDTALAEQEYRAAVRLSPRFAPAYANLADLQRALGGEAECEQTLRLGLTEAPASAVLEHALGLSLIRQRRLADALPRLKAAAEHDLATARYAYVYAVALEADGRRDEAIDVLKSVAERHPGDVEAGFALTSYLFTAGRLAEAAASAERLAELRPGDAEIERLRSAIRAAGPQ